MQEIIDSHTHIDYLNRNESYDYLTTMQSLLDVLDDNNVKKAVCSQMPYSTEFVDIQRWNTGDYNKIPFLLSNILLLEDKDKYDVNDKIIPFFNIHPQKKLVEQLHYIKEIIDSWWQCKWIKYNCQATNTNIDSINNPILIDFCREYKLPILLHTWVSKNWNASNVFDFIKNTPDIKFSVAHLWRLHRLFRNMVKNEWIPQNMFIDISPYKLVYLTQKVKQCKPWINLEDVDEKTLLHSICVQYVDHIIRWTDFPFVWDEELYKQWSYKENLLILDGLDPEIIKKITSINIKRFLWIDL